MITEKSECTSTTIEIIYQLNEKMILNTQYLSLWNIVLGGISNYRDSISVTIHYFTNKFVIMDIVMDYVITNDVI